MKTAGIVEQQVLTFFIYIVRVSSH